ncbi:MAG TPA: lipopolysaccharide biosynthesis protein [Gemmatimonadales bacterium]|nr:lipopolysaccharide biosynthesis protein [Gemmatimonadales bacterium]
MPAGSLLTDARRLVDRSAVYALGLLLLRGMSLLLIPLYTRYLDRAEYGIVAVAVSVTAVLAVLGPISLHGALARLYFDAQSDADRKRVAGALWVATVLAAGLLTLLLDRVGEQWAAILLPDVPFQPYIRLAIWTAFLTTFGLIPLNLLQIQERPGLYVKVTVAGTLITTLCIIWLVVGRGMGAYGYVLGTFIGSALLAIPYTVLAARMSTLGLRWNVTRAALAYSLPLVPHALAGWVLELSDRALLQRFVPLTQLGLYSLGYQLASLLTMAATAINFAWTPYMYGVVRDRPETAPAELGRMTTYYVAVLCALGLGIALLGGDILRFLTEPAYHPAYQVVPLIVLGLVFSGLYLVPASLLFLKSKTGLIPLVTVAAGAVNVALLLWLAPRAGIMAGAWATAAGYAVMLLLVWLAARSVFRLPYEYGRIGTLLVAAAAIFLATQVLSLPPNAAGAAGRGALWLLFPMLLFLLGFFRPAERQVLRRVIQRAGPP